MSFLTRKRCVGLKLETSPYTFPQDDLAQADYDFKAYDVSYGTTVEETKRQYALGNLSALSSIMGKRSGTVSFSVDMGYSGTAETAPEWAKLLKACGYTETIAGGKITYKPDSKKTATPAVIEVAELEEGASPKQVVVQLRGSMGNVTWELANVGAPIKMQFEFTGVIQNIKDRVTPIVPAGYDTTTAEAVLGAAVRVFDETLDLDSITVATGNTVELYVDPNAPEGYSGAHITGREPTAQLNPYMGTIANRPVWGRIVAGTTGEFICSVGDNMYIKCPKLQVIGGYDGSDRNGAVVNALNCILTGNSGDDEIEIVHGESATDKVTLTYIAGDNGSIIGDTVQVIDENGDGTAVYAEADTGYEFSQWSDESTDNPRQDTSVSANLTVTAEFTEII